MSDTSAELGIRSRHAVSARMPDADRPKPENPIHSTAAARDFGFRAALVGGVTVYGWAVPAVLDALGERWLHKGWAQLQFRRPVYPDDGLTVTVRATGALDIARDDGACIVGAVGCGRAPWLAAVQPPPWAAAQSRPSVLPRLTTENVPVGQTLRPLAAPLSVAAARAFARDKQLETSGPFATTAALGHPAWLAQLPIALLHHSFEYGPAIHVASHIQHLAPLRTDRDYVVRGRCIATYERRGNHYLVNDCAVADSEGQDVAVLRHAVIYSVAQSRGDSHA